MAGANAVEDLRAHGEKDLVDRLLKQPRIRRAIEQVEKREPEAGARRHLLGSALRLSRDMAPDIGDTIDRCRNKLAIETQVEAYVYPSPMFNAAAVRPEQGVLFIMLSSSLLEAFQPDELSFVVGHELGHHLFEHHRVPVGAPLAGREPVSAALALQLFSWQRYAEISSDRAGVVCAGGIDGAAQALFKLASGLRGDRVRVRIEHFLAQVRDLREEVGRLSRSDEPARSDLVCDPSVQPPARAVR